MNTLTRFFFCLGFLFFSFSSLKSQQVEWNQINSNSVLDLAILQAVDNHTSYSNILQIGDSNNIEAMINAKTNIMIQQLGDYNSLYFNNSFSDTKTKNVINTQGNNNIIDITGSNSVSENMKVNVKGDNMTIFMRNY
ncbi:hypothetical protein LPB85_18370 [Chryseobacterium sp. LC2016-27]|uniref:hypothetical protein n=1 Tax=unclassified Chryseobacterium TaxID=2593645 RepID=UPI001E6080D8|nr:MULTISPECIES: hypothetical protein [unclassified Chryseobacterium]MCD0457407.1 hypothetical protein [Chryseobacterium sp. LC2016-27]MCD0479297.1 hypothetical protein [Chryseobacterium sp. LC2016-29]